MPQVFFSWTKPDEAAAMRLRNRLLDAGIDVWEYSEQMRAGDEIPEAVHRAIDSTKVAVFCLSDAAASRKWLIGELALADRAKGVGTLKKIMPVRVGTLSEDTLKQLGVDPNLYVLDESRQRQREETYVRFTQSIWEALALEAPVVVPTALFALTRAEYQDMRTTPDRFQDLAALCVAAGMPAAPTLLEALDDRYGDHPEDFAPFFPRRPLVELVHEAERLTNRARVAAGKRPIFVRWCTDELSKPTADQDPAIRDLWMYRNSLLIVDSASALSARVQQRVLELPPSRGSVRTAVVWVPPYTRHSVALEDSIRRSSSVPRFVDLFRDWREARTDDDVAFDIGTSATLRLFLKRAFLDVVDNVPLPERVESLKQAQPRVAFRARDAF
jgi:hypothetical protein